MAHCRSHARTRQSCGAAPQGNDRPLEKPMPLEREVVASEGFPSLLGVLRQHLQIFLATATTDYGESVFVFDISSSQIPLSVVSSANGGSFLPTRACRISWWLR